MLASAGTSRRFEPMYLITVTRSQRRGSQDQVAPLRLGGKQASTGRGEVAIEVVDPSLDRAAQPEEGRDARGVHHELAVGIDVRDHARGRRSPLHPDAHMA